MKIAVVDYGLGNLGSVTNAFRHVGAPVTLTGDPEALRAARALVLPGDGAFGTAMEELRARGLLGVIRDAVSAEKPLLGICVGMQLLFEHSDEDGGVSCLGVLDGVVERFRPGEAAIKVPHMGWNTVAHDGDPLFAGIPSGERFYFVHSYYCAPDAALRINAVTDHGGKFAAGVRRDNLVAVQFHPEKSGEPGLRLLRNFVSG